MNSLRILLINTEPTVLSRVLICSGHTPKEVTVSEAIEQLTAQPHIYHAIIINEYKTITAQPENFQALLQAVGIPLLILDPHASKLPHVSLLPFDIPQVLVWLDQITKPTVVNHWSQTGLFLMIYGSYAVPTFSECDLLDILSVSRYNNEKIGITGTLIYSNGRIMQVLEGDYAAVNALFYGKIAHDKRHMQATVLLQEFAHTRVFSDWHMGFYKNSPSDFNLLGRTDLNVHFGGQYIKKKLLAAKTFLDYFA